MNEENEALPCMTEQEEKLEQLTKALFKFPPAIREPLLDLPLNFPKMLKEVNARLHLVEQLLSAKQITCSAYVRLDNLGQLAWIVHRDLTGRSDFRLTYSALGKDTPIQQAPVNVRFAAYRALPNLLLALRREMSIQPEPIDMTNFVKQGEN